MSSAKVEVINVMVGGVNSQISASWEAGNRAWQPKVIVSCKGYLCALCLPVSVASVDRLVAEFASKGVAFAEITDSYKQTMVGLIQGALDACMPPVSLFAIHHSDKKIVKGGDIEVAIACEWWNGGGERWMFLTTFFFADIDEVDYSWLPDLEETAGELVNAGMTDGVHAAAKEALSYIIQHYENYPQNSASESYYGS